MARKRLDTCLLMLNKLCCVRCLLKNVDFTGIRAVASVKIGFCSLRLYTLFPGSTTLHIHSDTPEIAASLARTFAFFQSSWLHGRR